jgi:hypothetical protein
MATTEPPSQVALSSYSFFSSRLSGQDLNRVWDNPTLESHPTIYHCKKLAQELQAVCFSLHMTRLTHLSSDLYVVAVFDLKSLSVS